MRPKTLDIFKTENIQNRYKFSRPCMRQQIMVFKNPSKNLFLFVKWTINIRRFRKIALSDY